MWIQQLGFLLYKRFKLFYRRYILAFVIILGPVLIEGLAAYFIPPQSYLIDQLGGTVQKYGSLKLDFADFRPQYIPYSIYGDGDIASIKSLVKKFVNPIATPGTELEFIPNATANEIDEYVLNQRLNNVNNFVNNYYMGFAINISSTDEIRLSAYYSTLAYHSCAAIISLVDNIFLSYLNSFNQNMSITTHNTPLPANATIFRGNRFLKYLACFDVLPLSLLNTLTAINIAFFISLLVMHASRERINGFKILQVLSGTHKTLYWISHYIFDIMLCFINVSLIIGILVLVGYYQNDVTSELYVITSFPTIGYVALLLFISSFTWPPVAHLWSFLFKSDVTGFVILALILGIAPFLDVVLSFVILFLNTNQDDPTKVAAGTDGLNVLRYILFIFFPNVTVKKGIYNLKIRNNMYCINSTNKILNSKPWFHLNDFINNKIFLTLEHLVINEPYLSVNDPGIGMLLIFSLIQLAIGILIIVAIETNFFRIMKLKKKICRSNIVDSFSSNTVIQL